METKLLNKRWKQITALVLAVILLIMALYVLLRVVFSFDILDRSGFVKLPDGVRYTDYYGKVQKGWKYIDGELYYFDPDTGYMYIGWQELDGARYYFGTDGIRATGWQEVDGKTYYLHEDGKLATGWCQIDGKTYNFTDEGAMAIGWQEVDGKRCYFSAEGTALTGWHTIEDKRYYFTADGYTLSGWQTIDNVRFMLTEEGAVVTGWYEDETGKYFFEEDGHPHNGWLEWQGKRYYCDENGAMKTGWLQLEQDTYYLQADGTMAIGKLKIDGINRFFTSKGKSILLTNRWNPVPEDYVVKLASIEGFQFDSAGRDALQQMLEDCRAAGLSVEINNTYRSKATQQRMWDRSVQKYMNSGMTREQAEKETGKDTALPGHSEHQTGLAADINGSQAVYDWLAEHCWDYGFILRYPEGHYNITGIIYEPWHFRYVGTELSLELKELGLCLEEYMDMLTAQQNTTADKGGAS